MLPLELSLELELNDGNRFVHLSYEAKSLLVDLPVFRSSKRLELQARIVGIGFHRECGKRKEVDSVAFFERSHVCETQRKTQNDGDTSVTTCSSTHPKCIMIAPLQIEVLASEQIIHNDVGSRTTVKDVAKNVKLVDAQLVDDITDSDNEVASLPYLYDCLNDSLHIGILVFVVWTFVKEFFDDVGELFWKGFADLASSVLAAYGLTNLDELQECLCIEARQVLVCAFLYHFETLFRIVDEGAEIVHHIFW